jgi:glycosyltransferase involved in cell wall biosynthesis
MRILHLNHYGSNIGGAEGYIADVSRALSRAGHETVLASFAWEEPDRLMPGTVQITASKAEATRANLERVLVEFRPDVAYIHVVHDAQVLRWILGRLPAISYVHSAYLVCPGYGLFLRRSSRVCTRTAGTGCLLNAQVERCCFGRNPANHVRQLRRVQQLLGVTSLIDVLVGSQFMKRQLVNNGIAAEKVSILPPVLIAEPWPKYDPPSSTTNILFSGRVTDDKGLRRLIEALGQVRGDWHLIVAGNGPDLEACQQRARELGIAQWIDFLGWVEPGEMDALFRRCAFVTVPSLLAESYGRVGPEAYAHGRPAVAFAVGGIPDWLEEGETGYLASPGDVSSLRTAIELLLNSPGDQERMGRTAHERARMLWNADTHVSSLLAYLQRAIDAFDCGPKHAYNAIPL